MTGWIGGETPSSSELRTPEQRPRARSSGARRQGKPSRANPGHLLAAPHRLRCANVSVVTSEGVVQARRRARQHAVPRLLGSPGRPGAALDFVCRVVISASAATGPTVTGVTWQGQGVGFYLLRHAGAGRARTSGSAVTLC